MAEYREYKGRCVKCVFICNKCEAIYEGYISGLRLVKKQWLFRVQYDDGDVYDYTKNEIDRIVINKWKFNNVCFHVNSSCRLPIGNKAVLFVEWFSKDEIIQEWITYTFDQIMYILQGDEIIKFLNYVKHRNSQHLQQSDQISTKFNMLTLSMASQFIDS